MLPLPSEDLRKRDVPQLLPQMRERQESNPLQAPERVALLPGTLPEVLHEDVPQQEEDQAALQGGTGFPSSSLIMPSQECQARNAA